ncbi:MAG TPA: UvrB/UvrC motif-containing protein [Pirellulaceae bacterium]|nr:UvrB/UvrC motif-containing protein [Pirellulaceae bacterium]
MEHPQHIDHILKQWTFDPSTINVRKLWIDQRQVLQLRLDMGILQMEVDHRPDGKRPHGAKTYLDYLVQLAAKSPDSFQLHPEHYAEIDREFAQYYHRRICWLQLQEFDSAVNDADHTLQLMDFCKRFSTDEQWSVSHEQYRPFVLYQRTQAAALAVLEHPREEGGGNALCIVDDGLEEIRRLFVEHDAEDQFESDELVVQLREFRQQLQKRFEPVQLLVDQLNAAVANEDYELAARLRDRIATQEKDSRNSKRA